jgi:hypothetical protein
VPTASVMLRIATAAAALLLAPCTDAVELTPDTWDEKTAGKSVFVKFQAPW